MYVQRWSGFNRSVKAQVWCAIKCAFQSQSHLPSSRIKHVKPMNYIHHAAADCHYNSHSWKKKRTSNSYNFNNKLPVMGAILGHFRKRGGQHKLCHIDVFSILEITYRLVLWMFVFAPQMGRPTRGGSAGGARSTSTGADRGLASRNVPVASTGTALTPSTTATVTLTPNSGESAFHSEVHCFSFAIRIALGEPFVSSFKATKWLLLALHDYMSHGKAFCVHYVLAFIIIH